MADGQRPDPAPQPAPAMLEAVKQLIRGTGKAHLDARQAAKTAQELRDQAWATGRAAGLSNGAIAELSGLKDAESVRQVFERRTPPEPLFDPGNSMTIEAYSTPVRNVEQLQGELAAMVQKIMTDLVGEQGLRELRERGLNDEEQQGDSAS